MINRYRNARVVWGQLMDVLGGERGGMEGQCMTMEDWDILVDEAWAIMKEGILKAAKYDELVKGIEFLIGEIPRAFPEDMPKESRDWFRVLQAALDGKKLEFS